MLKLKWKFLFSTVLSLNIVIFSGVSSFAEDSLNSTELSSKIVQTQEIEGSVAESAINLVDVNVEEYTFTEIDNRITNEDGKVLLGYYEPKDIQPRDYYEYDRWYVYDNGITNSWSYLSNPYFIKSIAKGMTYQKTETVNATIAATFSGTIPAGSKSTVNKTFGINSSGNKTISETITLSGPSGSYNSRDFYYKKGRHTHSLRIVQEHRSNWDGVLWKKTYSASVGVPAIKTYSVDRK